eukprot:TRINITY_DN37191_c0_g1_i1.p1 TRINITY_DN37191_c0_g1~~TRINITY_DN37191_c0_g1_i1.p1  ORF type:complete len:452 (+),score=38.70 TRINITY_DN37191_c0_g1_i1:24-1358(+)
MVTVTADASQKEEKDDERRLRANFWWMSAAFALNHGTVTTPLVVASTLLGEQVADLGNGILYIVTLLSSLFLAAPLTDGLGSKGALMFGMFFYCIYVTGFALASFFQGDPSLPSLCFIPASACGGLAAGVLWTGQGSYFSSVATELSEVTNTDRQATTSKLASKFAFVYLSLEVASKLSFSALQAIGVQIWQTGFFYAFIGVFTLWMMSCVDRIGSRGTSTDGLATQFVSKILTTASLWSDPLIWLLSPTNLTFGFCAAFMNGHVNARFASKELGPQLVAFLAALTAATAAVMSQILRPLASRYGKGVVICAGAMCFFFIPLCILQLECCSGWGWRLILLYILQGTGRAVYESTNRATFSDFFTGEKTEGAFANCMLQSSLSFASSFFLQTVLSTDALAYIVIALALSTPICYAMACFLQTRRLNRSDINSSESLTAALTASAR